MTRKVSQSTQKEPFRTRSFLHGFVEAEILLSAAIIAIIVTAIVGSLTVGQQSALIAADRVRAVELANEGMEAVRNIRDWAFNEFTYTQSGVEVSSGEWIYSGEATTETIGKFTRTITFADVCRDGANDVATCPATTTDVHTKQATVTMTWTSFLGLPQSIAKTALLTNWGGTDWTQTNWVGDSGQTIWSDATMFDTNDGGLEVDTSGQVTLLSGNILDNGFGLPTSVSNDWTFTTASQYTYDDTEIQVTGGNAELKPIGATVSGDTVNPDFDVDATSWAYADWEQSGGEDVTGSHVASGGNPTGYINVDIPGKKSITLSGYWEQSFVTTVSNPSIATLDMDWFIPTFSNVNLTSYQLYAFVDSASGAPSVGNEVWSSGEITSTTSWASVPTVDVSNEIGATGTYYVKVAARAITSGGIGTVGDKIAGFDNVEVHWEDTPGGSYPTTIPSIYQTDTFQVPGVQSWDSFTETATKNGGEIYYQMSSDGGITWLYWDGFAWVTAGASNYNTASVVNTNIGSISIVSGEINFKAFLESDGTQLVQLDNVNIAFTAPPPVWTFYDWDVDGGEVTPFGTQQISGGNPGGYVQVTVPEGNNDEIGGYWEQPFTTYANTPTPFTVDFDYNVTAYESAPALSELRVFIDTSSGVPTNQVGSSTTLTGITGWTANAQIDAESAVPTTGVYYLKIAFWLETGTRGGQKGEWTAGFDNVILEMGNAEFIPSGIIQSSAYDMSDASPVQIIEWDETMPVCTPECDIDFEVRSAPDSSGSPGVWSSWYGSGGASTTFDDPGGTLISTDLNGNQWIQYRMTFITDGRETPVLDEVRLNYR